MNELGFGFVTRYVVKCHIQHTTPHRPTHPSPLPPEAADGGMSPQTSMPRRLPAPSRKKTRPVPLTGVKLMASVAPPSSSSSAAAARSASASVSSRALHTWRERVSDNH